MNTSLVLTIIGKDRPGLVESIAKLISQHEGNWLESRMAHLAGQFAGILRVEVEEARATELTEALKELTAVGIESVVYADATTEAASDAPLVLLDLVGQDRPGIVREITRVLAEQHVNVEELETERYAAATTGQLLFSAKAALRLPADTDQATLRAALEAVAGDLMVDVQLATEG